MGEVSVNRKVIFFYLIFGVGLLQYQSCAPSPENFDTSAESSVNGIDEVTVGDISFPQSKVSAFVNQPLSVPGLCQQSGALIGWKLINDNDEVVERGLAPCELGSFNVELSDRWESHCGSGLRIQAALGADAISEILVDSVCE